MTSRPTIHGSASLLLLIGGLLLAAPAGFAASSVSTTFSTGEPIDLRGSVQAQALGGVQASWGEEARVALEAEQVEVTTVWERGEHGEIPDTFQHRTVEDRGTDEWTFTDADVTFTPWDDEAELLAEPNAADATVGGNASGQARLDPIATGEKLAQGGYSDRGVATSDEDIPSYVYRPEEPIARQSGVEDARVEGSFTLFVDTATITVSEADGGMWTNWTGHRERASTQATTSYELRVTVLEVTGGQLAVRDADEAALLAPDVDLALAGELSADAAEGTIGRTGEQIRLDGSPLKLSGDGTASVSAVGTSDEGRPVFHADARGSFDVLSHDLPTTATTAASTSTGWLPWLATAAGLALVLVAVVRRDPRALRVLPAGLRARVYRRWLAKGRALEEEQAFEEAGTVYARLTAIEPRQPIGWYHRCRACLEAGEDARVLAILEDAKARLDSPPLDLLEIEVAAAERSGQANLAKQALLELAETAPEMAQGLIADLDLSRLRRDPEVQAALGTERRTGGLQGYA